MYLSEITRREFLRMAGIGTSMAFMPACAPGDKIRKGKLISPDSKLRIAAVGCGGKGFSDIRFLESEEIVALCDVDDIQAQKTYNKYPQVPKYKDFRIMLQEMDEQVDAVTVSTPDHMHFAVAMAAIERGKHVFVQKPLTTTIWEARELAKAARRHEVVTVMGNQGHATDGTRLTKEWADSGILGDVELVHCWTIKLQDGKYRSAIREKEWEGKSVPDNLDWNLWVGPNEMKPYSDEVAPFRWRGWWAYGNGALGDIGCHTMDAPFYALELGAPVAVTAETSGYNEFTFPDWSVITYEFPARGKRPPCKLVWYDGGKLPELPSDMEGIEFNPKAGYLMMGSKATVYNPTEKGESPRIVPEAKRQALRDSMPEPSIPRVPAGGPHMEWVRACKGGPTPGSNFDYAGPLTEMVLLGNLAIRAKGNRILWDSENLKVTNMPELNKYVKPAFYREF
jgi:predicted dehydrogenase